MKNYILRVYSLKGTIYNAEVAAKSMVTAIRLATEAIARKERCRPSQLDVYLTYADHSASKRTTSERVIRIIP